MIRDAAAFRLLSIIVVLSARLRTEAGDLPNHFGFYIMFLLMENPKWLEVLISFSVRNTKSMTVG